MVVLKVDNNISQFNSHIKVLVPATPTPWIYFVAGDQNQFGVPIKRGYKMM